MKDQKFKLEVKKGIWAIIKKNDTQSDDYIPGVSSDHILSQLYYYGIDISDRELRHLIKEMIESDSYPIGSHYSIGYFLCNTQERYDMATEPLKAAARSKLYRCARLKNNVEKLFNKDIQLEMDFLK